MATLWISSLTTVTSAGLPSILFIHEFQLLPERFSLCRGFLSFSVLPSNLFSFTGIQTDDCYFNGFPAMWNLVVSVMFVLQSRPIVNVVVVLIFVMFTIVPLKFIHPIRVRDFRRLTIPILVVWLLAMTYLIWILDSKTADCSEKCLPPVAVAAQIVVYFGSIWIIGIGIWRTLRGDPAPEPASIPSGPAALLRRIMGIYRPSEPVVRALTGLDWPGYSTVTGPGVRGRPSDEFRHFGTAASCPTSRPAAHSTS